MKTFLLSGLAGILLSCAHGPAIAQEFKEHITKEFTLPKGPAGTTLAIYNIHGFIKVEGYSGDKILMEIDKTITAPDNQTLEAGKKEFKLQFEQKDDSLVAYIAEPYDSRPNRQHWDNHNRIKYEGHLTFTVKVPFLLNLHVSTVNGGDVGIKDVAGTVFAHNVNGAISLTNAKGATDVHTINGDVVINYLSNPPGTSSYYTLNGDIRVSYPASLSADLQFKSFQGDFFTDFPNVEVLPVKAVKEQQKSNKGTVYKLHKDTVLRIGSGGQTFRFETFNGNIYIKKQS